MFTWNKKWSLRPIKMENTTLTLSNSAKFLGVMLNCKLNFNEYILHITKKATASLMLCKRALGPKWGLTPKTCKWLYTTIIRPIMTYCTSIWIRVTYIDHKSQCYVDETGAGSGTKHHVWHLVQHPIFPVNSLTITPDNIIYL